MGKVIKTMEVRVEGWRNGRDVRLTRDGKLSFEVAFHQGDICQGRVRDLRRRIEEGMCRGEFRNVGNAVWLDVKLRTDDQFKNPLKYLAKIVGAKITEIKDEK